MFGRHWWLLLYKLYYYCEKYNFIIIILIGTMDLADSGIKLYQAYNTTIIWVARQQNKQIPLFFFLTSQKYTQNLTFFSHLL